MSVTFVISVREPKILNLGRTISHNRSHNGNYYSELNETKTKICLLVAFIFGIQRGSAEIEQGASSSMVPADLGGEGAQ